MEGITLSSFLVLQQNSIRAAYKRFCKIHERSNFDKKIQVYNNKKNILILKMCIIGVTKFSQDWNFALFTLKFQNIDVADM